MNFLLSYMKKYSYLIQTISFIDEVLSEVSLMFRYHVILCIFFKLSFIVLNIIWNIFAFNKSNNSHQMNFLLSYMKKYSYLIQTISFIDEVLSEVSLMFRYHVILCIFFKLSFIVLNIIWNIFAFNKKKKLIQRRGKNSSLHSKS